MWNKSCWMVLATLWESGVLLSVFVLGGEFGCVFDVKILLIDENFIEKSDVVLFDDVELWGEG